MFQLLAIGPAAYFVIWAVSDVIADGGPAGLARALAGRLGKRVDVAEVASLSVAEVASLSVAEVPKLEEWLTANGGTTDFSPADRAFFEQQVGLAYRDVKEQQ